MYQPYLLLIILLTTMGLFIWGRWRYDIVAFFALMVSVLVGIVPFHDAFSGFSNPAVITVACVMIITQAISQSGVLNYLIKKVDFLFENMLSHMMFLCFTSGILSAFMNNVGALGLMMPITIETCLKNDRSPSIGLMPIAFASVLGGLMTAIGTPPNLLISQYRQSIAGEAFGIFDFTPVGFLVALAGILFIALIGWRLIPVRQKYAKAEDLFQISDYMAEFLVVSNSLLAKKTVKEMNEIIKTEHVLIAIIHKGKKKFAFTPEDKIYTNDVLIIETSPENIEKILQQGKLKLAGDKPFSSKMLSSEKVTLLEAVVPPDSDVEGYSANSLRLRARHRINLLALSRKGIALRQKLHDIRFQAGDVILLQGSVDIIRETIVGLGLLPLAERSISVGISRQSFLPFLFFLISITLAALNILPIAIAFAFTVLAIILFRVIPVRLLYTSMDWPVLLLLAAMIPVGQAIQTTGAADLITEGFMLLGGHLPPVFTLAAVLIVTMSLSDLMNNAATTVVMAPIAVKIAESMHAHIDPFLMAVAIGASCSFLTPIAHQNNVMVMGPGGYQFFDYARMGLPLELIILIVALPTIMWIWPM